MTEQTTIDQLRGWEGVYRELMVVILKNKQDEDEAQEVLGQLPEFEAWNTARADRLNQEKRLKEIESTINGLALKAKAEDPEAKLALGTVKTRSGLTYDPDEAVKWLVEKDLLGMLQIKDDKEFSKLILALGASRPDWAKPTSEEYFAFARKALKEQAEAEFELLQQHDDDPEGLLDLPPGQKPKLEGQDDSTNS